MTETFLGFMSLEFLYDDRFGATDIFHSRDRLHDAVGNDQNEKEILEFSSNITLFTDSFAICR